MEHGLVCCMVLFVIAGIAKMVFLTGNVYHVLYSWGCSSSLTPSMKIGLMIDTLQSNNWYCEMLKKEQYEKN